MSVGRLPTWRAGSRTRICCRMRARCWQATRRSGAKSGLDDGGWFMRAMLPYRSDDSGVQGVVITFAGISEMKAAEREIEAARAYLDSIIATIRQPLVVLDDELRVISASSSFHRIFSVKPEDLIGRHLLAAGDHLDVAALREFLVSIQARGTSINDHEVELELPTLGRRTFLMSARVLREEPAARRKILVAIVDVTEARREGRALEAAKSEAERANVGKSRFLAAASHDLRQPLQTISLLQGMLDKRVHDEATRRLVHRLDETVRTMSSLLDKLLDINQLEAGIVRPAIVDFPINRLLEEMRTEFTYHTETNGLGWRVVPSRLTVRSDPRLLEQIIRNLLSNAVKYTTGGRLLLGCRRRGDMLRIEVWDTGAGIPELELQAIFEEFHQLDNPARERSKGLGLGLAIVQRLSDLLGHKIDVRSRLGTGSVFSIEVPLGRPETAHEPVLDQNKTQANATTRGTILIVEDDPAVLEMLQLLFDDEGHRTLVAADGQQGAGVGGPGVDHAGPDCRRLQPAERAQRARGHSQAARASSARNSGHHPDGRHIRRQPARDCRPRLRASEQTRQGQRADAPCAAPPCQARVGSADARGAATSVSGGGPVVHHIRRRRRPLHSRGDARSARG